MLGEPRVSSNNNNNNRRIINNHTYTEQQQENKMVRLHNSNNRSIHHGHIEHSSNHHHPHHDEDGDDEMDLIHNNNNNGHHHRSFYAGVTTPPSTVPQTPTAMTRQSSSSLHFHRTETEEEYYFNEQDEMEDDYEDENAVVVGAGNRLRGRGSNTSSSTANGATQHHHERLSSKIPRPQELVVQDAFHLFNSEFKKDQKLIASRYIRGRTLGQGMYGTVFSAIDKVTKQVVAIKSLMRRDEEEDELSVTEFRELMSLGALKDCRFVLRFIDFFLEDRQLMVVMEQTEESLHYLIDGYPNGMPMNTCMRILYMLLIGMAYCHQHDIVHRDLKPDNVLMVSNVVKLADFGLSLPFYNPNRPNSPEVVTLLYRAPELFFQNVQYGPTIDIWSIGCIFAELLRGSPLFKGSTEITLLETFISILGTPPREVDPQCLFITNKKIDFNLKTFKSYFPSDLPNEAVDLMLKMLDWNPQKRITARQALNHPFFDSQKQNLLREFQTDLDLLDWRRDF